jgi:hypothetical protein
VAKGGTLKFVRRHRVTLASVGVVVIGAAALLVFALSSRGYRVRHVDLNDGGIWVTSNREGLFGRLNKPAGSLDAAMNPVAKTVPPRWLGIRAKASSTQSTWFGP